MSDHNPANQWEVTTIGNIATINPPKPKYQELTDRDLVGFVPMASVDDVSGTITTVEDRPLGELRNKSYRTFAPNDVLFAKITPCMENGKSAVVPNLPNGHGLGSTEFHVIRPNANVEARYLWRFIRQQSYRAEAESRMTGSVGQLRVPADFLRETEIPLLSIDEQRRIVERLDQIDARRDAAIAHLARARAILTNFRQSVLAAACSGRLTADWRMSNPEARVVELDKLAGIRKQRRGRPTNSPMDLAVPELPLSYGVTTIADIATVLEYGTSRKAGTEVGGIPVLRMGNIQDGDLGLSDLKYMTIDDEVERLMLHAGDLLFNRTNSPELVGKSAVWRGSDRTTFASYLIRVRFHEDAALPEYVNYWINSAWGRLWARHVKTDGVSQSNINGTKLGVMPVPLPPLEEQSEIVRRTEAALHASHQILTRVETASTLLNRTGQAALAKAFRGELVGGLE